MKRMNECLGKVQREFCQLGKVAKKIKYFTLL